MSWLRCSAWLRSSTRSLMTSSRLAMPRRHRLELSELQESLSTSSAPSVSSTLASSFGSVRLDVSPSLHGEEELQEEALLRQEEEKEERNVSIRARQELFEETIKTRMNEAYKSNSNVSSRKSDLSGDEWFFDDHDIVLKWTSNSNSDFSHVKVSSDRSDESKESKGFIDRQERAKDEQHHLGQVSEVDRQYFGSIMDLETGSKAELKVQTDLNDTRQMRETWHRSLKDLNHVDRQLMVGNVERNVKSFMKNKDKEQAVDEDALKDGRKKYTKKDESDKNVEEKVEFDPDKPPTISALQYVRRLRSSTKPRTKTKEDFVDEIGVSMQRRLTSAATKTALVDTDGSVGKKKRVVPPEVLSETQLNERFKAEKLNNLTSIEVMEMLERKIVFNDHDIFAINKIHGLPVSKDKESAHNLLQYLDHLAKFAQTERLYMVHRLDSTTSGVLVLAKTLEAKDKLSQLFRERKIDKRYWAVVRGKPQPDQGIISIPIQEVEIKGRRRMTVQPDYSNSQLITNKKPCKTEVLPAVTEYRVLSSANQTSLVEFKPITGYKHQVRVHAALGLGCPVIGDHKYSYIDDLGKPQKLAGETLHRLGIRQSKVRDLPLFLHAKHMQIPEWVPDKSVFLDAAMPHFFCRLIKRLKLQPASFVNV